MFVLCNISPSLQFLSQFIYVCKILIGNAVKNSFIDNFIQMIMLTVKFIFVVASTQAIFVQLVNS